VQPTAVESLRELAGQEDLDVRGRAASRTLATYQGGDVTTGEFAKLMQNVPAGQREQLKTAGETDLRGFVENEALKEYLYADAQKKNFRLSAAAVDSIRTGARNGIHQVLEMAGLANRRFPKGKAGNGAIQEAVRQLMEQTVSGQRQLPPLGKLGFALRNSYGADVNAESFQRVVDRMKTIRASQPQQGAQPGMGGQGMPRGGQPMPQGGQPMPAGGQPMPQGQPAQPQAAPQPRPQSAAPAGAAPGGQR
jgi:hypothetical protein